MLTPQELLEIVDTLYPLLDELNSWITTDLIRRLLARLARGKDLTFGATDQWQLNLYKDAGGHYEALTAELKKWTKKADAEVQAIFEDAGIRAWSADDAFYVEQGFASTPLLRSEPLMKILTDTYQRTNGEIHNFTRTAATRSEQRFIDVCDKAHLKVITGAQSYTGAVKEAVDELSGTQTKVRYPSGYTDTIETAVLRCVRTGTAQASGNLSLQGMIDHDWDLIRVSAHLGARYGDGGENPGNHFWWQGKLYSRTGKTPGYPLFEETTGYGTGEGLCGWNCRHSFGPGDPDHNPFQDYDAEENKKAYDLSQKQRAMERSVRHSKTKLLGYRTAIENCTDEEARQRLQEAYNSTALKLKQQNATYDQFCKENNLKRYDDRLRAAKWNRSEAAKAARAAERTAEDAHKNWLKSIGAENTSLNTLAKFEAARYNNSEEFQLLTGYNNAVTEGDISPLVGFDLYRRTSDEISASIVGQTTATGVEIKSFATHFIDRIIGQTSDAHAGMRQGVSIADALDALKNPVKIGEMQEFDSGDIRQSFFGENAIVTISIRDNRLIQTNPWKGK